MYCAYKRNTAARVCNYFCSGKPISFTYSESMFVALSIRHTMSIHHIVICGLPDPIIFFSLFHTHTILEKRVIEHKMCV